METMNNQQVKGENNEGVVNPNEKVENTNEFDVTGENTVIEEKVEVVYDPDEIILKNLYDSGKRELSTNDLIVSGIDTSRMASYSFSIGRYKLSRLLLIAPYILEKTN